MIKHIDFCTEETLCNLYSALGIYDALDEEVWEHRQEIEQIHKKLNEIIDILNK